MSIAPLPPIGLQGPSTNPSAPQISPSALSDAINAEITAMTTAINAALGGLQTSVDGVQSSVTAAAGQIESSLTAAQASLAADSTALANVQSGVTTISSEVAAIQAALGSAGTKPAIAAVPGTNIISVGAAYLFTKTISAPSTFSVSNVPAGVTIFRLALTNGGSASVTWWSGLDWPSGVVPGLTAAGLDLREFATYDGGTTWFGTVLGNGMAAVGGGPPPPPPGLSPSPDPTSVTTTGQTIVDTGLNTWELVVSAANGLQVALNGVVDSTTANVLLLYWHGGVIYQENNWPAWWSWSGTAWVATSDPRPAAPAGSHISVSLTSPTGKSVSKMVFGISSGANAHANFDELMGRAGSGEHGATTAMLTSLGTIKFSVWRCHASEEVARLYAQGQTQIMNDWWGTIGPAIMASGYRLVMGVGWKAGGHSAANEAAWASTFAQAMKNQGHEIFYWEVDNEPGGTGADYAAWFNPIADALHNVNPAYKVGGTTGSWYGAVDLSGFFTGSGSRVGFVCFHSYRVGPANSNDACMASAHGFGDITSARNAMRTAGYPDTMEIALNEFNMDGNPGEEPRQTTHIGMLYIDLLLTASYKQDPMFTMGGLWDMYADGNYGVVENNLFGGDPSRITPQGQFLGYAGKNLYGPEVATSTTLSNLELLATKPSPGTFCIKLTNYSMTTDITDAITLVGGAPTGTITRWELGNANQVNAAIGVQASLSSVSIPRASTVMLSGTFA
jgi:hypothetical protein